MFENYTQGNPVRAGKVIGDFVIEQDVDFNSHLKSIQENFDANNIDMVSDFGTIIGAKTFRNMYTDKLLENSRYEFNNVGDEFNQQYLRLNGDKLEQIVENSIDNILSESQATGSLNPFVGLTPPIIVRNWIENFYKDVIETVSADKTIINRQLERAYIMDAEGVKHYLPEAIHDDAVALGIWKGIGRPIVGDKLTLPVSEYDIIGNTAGASRKQRDSLNNDIHVKTIYVTVKDTDGTTDVEKAIPVEVRPDITWGRFFYSGEVVDTHATGQPTITYFVSGQLNRGDGTISVFGENITAVELGGTMSSENNIKSASVGWERMNKQIVIGTKPHLNTGLNKEMIKTEKALYGVDAVSKTIKLMTQTLSHFKDLEIKEFLNNSYDKNKETEFVISTEFNCLPGSRYTGIPEEWVQRRLMNKIEKVTIQLKDILKTPNIYFKIVGNPFNIRLFESEVKWVVGENSDNSSINGIKLDYSFGIMTNQHKYHVLSSSRVGIDEGIRIYAMPLDGMHKTFTHYDFAFFLENDYRDPNNMGVPSVMATSMYTNDELFPIQSQIVLLNNTLDDPTELWS